MAVEGEMREMAYVEGKRYTKTILTMTYLSLIFNVGAIHPLIRASIVTPSFDKARPWVVARSTREKREVLFRVRIGAQASTTHDGRRNGVITYLVSDKFN